MAREEKRGAPVDSDALFAEAVRTRHAKAESDALEAFKAGNIAAHAAHTRLANALAGVLDVLK